MSFFVDDFQDDVMTFHFLDLLNRDAVSYFEQALVIYFDRVQFERPIKLLLVVDADQNGRMTAPVFQSLKELVLLDQVEKLAICRSDQSIQRRLGTGPLIAPPKFDEDSQIRFFHRKGEAKMWLLNPLIMQFLSRPSFLH